MVGVAVLLAALAAVTTPAPAGAAAIGGGAPWPPAALGVSQSTRGGRRNFVATFTLPIPYPSMREKAAGVKTKMVPVPRCQPTVVFLSRMYRESWAVARLFVNPSPAWAIFIAARRHAAAWKAAHPPRKGKTPITCNLQWKIPALLRQAVDLVVVHERCHKRKDPNCPLPPDGIFRQWMNKKELRTQDRVVNVPLGRRLPAGILPKRVWP